MRDRRTRWNAAAAHVEAIEAAKAALALLAGNAKTTGISIEWEQCRRRGRTPQVVLFRFQGFVIAKWRPASAILTIGTRRVNAATAGEALAEIVRSLQ